MLGVLRDASANAKMGEDHSGSRVERNGKREVSERNWTSVTHLQPYCSTSAEDKARGEGDALDHMAENKDEVTHRAKPFVYNYVIVSRDSVSEISFLESLPT